MSAKRTKSTPDTRRLGINLPPAHPSRGCAVAAAPAPALAPRQPLHLSGVLRRCLHARTSQGTVAVQVAAGLRFPAGRLQGVWGRGHACSWTPDWREYPLFPKHPGQLLWKLGGRVWADSGLPRAAAEGTLGLLSESLWPQPVPRLQLMPLLSPPGRAWRPTPAARRDPSQ